VTGDPVAGVVAANGLYKRFRDFGQVSIQTYGVTEGNFGGEFDATVVGGELRYAQSEAKQGRLVSNQPGLAQVGSLSTRKG